MRIRPFFAWILLSGLLAIFPFAATPGTAVAAANPLFSAQTARLVPGDPVADQEFGTEVAISGDTLVVSTPFDNQAGYRSGAAYVFAWNGLTWTQQAKLVAGDAAAEDWFGVDVDIDGDTIVVGASRADDGADRAGAVYVFRRQGAAWQQQAKLTAGDVPASREFGNSVSISGDLLVVGAWQDGQKGNYAGAAYAFARSGTAWTQQAKLTAGDGAASDFFGFDVALSGDTAVVGAIYDDDGTSGAGSAYVFQQNGATWTQKQKLTASDVGDSFGCAVDMDGDTIVIGSYTKNVDGVAGAGAAYVFARSDALWAEEQRLVASDAATSDQFGWSVALNGDILLVGAITVGDSGYVYAFQQGEGDWIEQQKIVPAGAAPDDAFGNAVGVASDLLVMGSPGDDSGGNASGSVYVYRVAGAAVELTPLLGGSVVYTDTQGLSTTVQVPPGAVTAPTDLFYWPSAGPGMASEFAFAGHSFDLVAYTNGVEQPGLAFQQPSTLTVHYADFDVALVTDETQLQLLTWNGSAWVDAADSCAFPSTYTRDTVANWLSLPICHLGHYGMFGPTNRIFLPLLVR